MAITPTSPPRFAVLRRIPWSEIGYQAVGLLRSVLFHVVAGTALLILLASLYVVKRALGLDLFPGLDLLPDVEIEDALLTLAGLLGD